MYIHGKPDQGSKSGRMEQFNLKKVNYGELSRQLSNINWNIFDGMGDQDARIFIKQHLLSISVFKRWKTKVEHALHQGW